ncbi:pyridoxal phosphate-dependent aminotransferase [Bifidobacterium sp.]|uniref:pyridoxal phosphate-dependent aminotransferase n=1 Tax=Bifidobacterium sp. TaxID=41200 RepID=UPI0039EB37D6
MHFSSRVEYGSLNPIAREEQEERGKGKRFSKLNDANPTIHGLAPEILPGPYHADPRGPLEAREAIASFISRHEGTGDGSSGSCLDGLYVLSSTSQAYSWLMKLLCDANEAILVPKPGYPLVDSIARLECVQSISYPLRFDGSWTIDIAAIEEMLKQDVSRRIRAIVVINPNNPTASYVQGWERERLVGICEAYDLAIIADEVFFEYSLQQDDADDARSHGYPGHSDQPDQQGQQGQASQTGRRFAGESRVLTFALDGFSKLVAAPHAKVGWIRVSGPQSETNEACARLDTIADDYLPMSDIIAREIPQLMKQADTQLDKVRERTRDNYARLLEIVAENPSGVADVLPAQAGWNVLLRLPSVIDEDLLVLSLLHEHCLSAQPGYYFDMPFNGVLAISLLPQPSVFERQVRAVLSQIDELLDA